MKLGSCSSVRDDEPPFAVVVGRRQYRYTTMIDQKKWYSFNDAVLHSSIKQKLPQEELTRCDVWLQ